MIAKANMICPGCQTFQPYAATCNTCGIVTAKVGQPARSAAQKPTASAPSGGLEFNKTLILLIAIPVIGYFAFSGSDDAGPTADAQSSDVSAQDKASKSSPTDRLAAIHPGAAAHMQRNNTKSKLHALKTALYAFSVEGDDPPTNEEGLQVFVDRRYLSESDITDDWGHKFVYRLKWGKETPWGKEYEIRVHSKGPDGVSGNHDDIGMP